MPRLWIISDLHTEVGGASWNVDPPEHDVVVLAGDVGLSPSSAIEWAADNFSKPVVYVAGTREFHERDRRDAIEEGRRTALRHPSVSFLENDSVVVCGTTFLGATLWSDFGVFGSEMEDFVRRQAERLVIDFHRILSNGRGSGNFSTADSKKIHAASRQYLKQAALAVEGPLVVVTHHAPHPSSINRRWIGDESVAAWVNDMGDDFGAIGADLWVHGGVHDTFDYEVSGTRVVCNPRGYPRMLFGGCENKSFDPRLTVEVSAASVSDEVEAA
jgi:Icc-related predicted phosphoesterase